MPTWVLHTEFKQFSAIAIYLQLPPEVKGEEEEASTNSWTFFLKPSLHDLNLQSSIQSWP